jgi:hypothetical protein
MVYINVAIKPAPCSSVASAAPGALALRQSGRPEYDAQTRIQRVLTQNSDRDRRPARAKTLLEGYPV